MRILSQLLDKYPCLASRSGVCIKVPNPPFMELTVESIGYGASGARPALSICHYGEQNGDAMRDPEMCFEFERVGESWVFTPYYWRNDYVGIEQDSTHRNELRKAHQSFADTWDRNLHSQGFNLEIEAGNAAVQE